MWNQFLLGILDLELSLLYNILRRLETVIFRLCLAHVQHRNEDVFLEFLEFWKQI